MMVGQPQDIPESTPVSTGDARKLSVRQERDEEIIQRYLQRGDPRDLHHVRLFNAMSRVPLGQSYPLYSPKIASRFLACCSGWNVWRCKNNPNHRKIKVPYDPCELRLLHDSCSDHQKKARIKKWERWITRIVERCSLSRWGGWKMEWAASGPGALARLGKHVQHWQVAGDWMLAVAHDVTRDVIRGFYLDGVKGDLFPYRSSYNKGNKSPLIRALCHGGRPWEWVPREMHRVPIASALALALDLAWLVDRKRPSDLTPSEAINLDRLYYHQPLYASHGLLYRTPMEEKDGCGHLVFNPACLDCGGGMRRDDFEVRLPRWVN
ncbi:MAG: hypothetical protein ACHP7P_03780 [Terriglobales bacterium]